MAIFDRFRGLRSEVSSLYGVALGRGVGLLQAYAAFREHQDPRQFAVDLLRLYPDRKMINLTLDSDTRTVRLEVQLRGQEEPLEVVGEGLEIIDEGRAAFLTLRGLRASPKWLSASLKPLRLDQRRIPIPEEYVEVAKLAL